MIMLQFHPWHEGWNRRVYWGQPKVTWGRDGTREMQRIGDMPPPGQWTQLEFRAVDLDLENSGIMGAAFTYFGGLCHFDRLAVVVGGKETVALEDEIPDKYRPDGNALQFVASPVKSGAKSWTGGPNNGVVNMVLMHQFWDGNWFTFKAPEGEKPPEDDPRKRRDVYREVADLVPDSPESWVFLQRILGTYSGDGAVREQIKECQDFLRRHPATPNALPILDRLRDLFAADGTHNTVSRCEDLMRDLKLPRDIQRAFYSKYVEGWTQWQAIGPFTALGERRGMDQVMDAERAFDPAWKPQGPFNKELAWKKIKNEKDPKRGKSSWVDLSELLMGDFDKQQRAEVERAPYFAYAYRKVSATQEGPAVAYFGAYDTISIWVNGQRVVTERQPGNEKDAGNAAIHLRNGDNEILIKVGCNERKLGFNFRLADPFGRPLQELPVD
ncbi:MAG: hypothetical protein M5U26_24775 [Planctomycetota bacterium]|nr:hypothetical protein [Planctomycetota bacterium]